MKSEETRKHDKDRMIFKPIFIKKQVEQRDIMKTEVMYYSNSIVMDATRKKKIIYGVKY